MYVDPMAVYRSTLQNAADAIDEAARRGFLAAGDRGRIDITVDQATRRVTIRDNGIGLAAADFNRQMTALGASRKRGTGAAVSVAWAG